MPVKLISRDKELAAIEAETHTALRRLERRLRALTGRDVHAAVFVFAEYACAISSTLNVRSGQLSDWVDKAFESAAVNTPAADKEMH